ncbi:MAG: hypothetical protein AMXMBFR82_04280 [Candidatus Hydrogenedentota bacterium]
MTDFINRRRFMQGVAAMGLATALPDANAAPDAREYGGPNVVVVRFGGGVRRRETIDPQHTYSPYFLHSLAKRGTLFTNMEIEQLAGVETSHGQGTLYTMTGRYERYQDVGGKFLGQRFESKFPTMFEYLRREYNVPPHQALIVNGEDRTDEEFYSFSNHHLFGVEYRSNVLSLYRFKTYLLRRQIEEGAFKDSERTENTKELAKLEALDYRAGSENRQSREIEAFWERWRQFYGETGFVNPRGDRLLTELSLRAMRELQPRLLMINYNDPDYVHWGDPTFYTRGIAVIDEGLQRLTAAVEADPFYRDNTVFVVVPDCGRDNNRLMPVPFQHHFNSKSSHEIFALLLGPGIARSVTVDRLVQQVDVLPTIGHIMNFETPYAEGRVLEEAIA